MLYASQVLVCSLFALVARPGSTAASGTPGVNQRHVTVSNVQTLTQVGEDLEALVIPSEKKIDTILCFLVLPVLGPAVMIGAGMMARSSDPGKPMPDHRDDALSMLQEVIEGGWG